jgi:hypothetical protein
VPEGASGEGSEDAADGTESGEADASDGQGLYLSPINEDEEEEEGVDCECRRIDQEQLSFNVGFFNAKVRPDWAWWGFVWAHCVVHHANFRKMTLGADDMSLRC